MQGRLKAIVGYITALFMVYAAFGAGLALYFNSELVTEAKRRCRLQCKIAYGNFQTRISRVSEALQSIVSQAPLSFPVSDTGPDALLWRLRGLKAQGTIDVFRILNKGGRVAPGLTDEDPGKADYSAVPVVARARSSSAAESGVFLVPGALLKGDEDVLPGAEKESRPPGSGARESKESEKKFIMAIGAAVPLRSETGEVKGFLYGAEVLQQDHSMVDSLKEEIVSGRGGTGRDRIDVSLLQENRVIASTLRDRQGKRLEDILLGELQTKKEVEACEEVDLKGERYLVSRRVLLDPAGGKAGWLGISLPKQPFTGFQRAVLGVFVVLVVATALGSAVFLGFHARGISYPLAYMRSVCERIAGGAASARIKRTLKGEMGQLASAINRMADTADYREQLSREIAREQFGITEKLASVGRLAAGVAHEISNPLTGILTFAHILRKQENLTAAQKEDLDVIIRETSRVEEIVRRLLDFARETPAVKELVSVNEVITETTKLLRSQKGFRSIRIREEFSEEVPEILADRNKLEQVFLNLGLNACEAMPDGGSLSIRTFVDGGRVTVRFSDTGVGIKDENIMRIFDPFFTTKPVGKGTGLGLSVAYGIVQQHGGAIYVDSEEGKGAVFTVLLPTSPSHHLQSQLKESIGSHGSRGK